MLPPALKIFLDSTLPRLHLVAFELGQVRMALKVLLHADFCSFVLYSLSD